MMTSKKKRLFVDNTISYAILIALALFVLVPILWMLTTSVRTEIQTYTRTPQWIPNPITFAAYQNFFQLYNFGRQLMNSIIVCLTSMVVCSTFACLTGYAATRFRFKGRKQLLGFLLMTQMFPGVMLVVPFYAILSTYRLTNSLLGLIVVYVGTNVAFSTWLITSYFRTIPIELDEAARVDGASSFRVFWNIILPLVVPGIAAVAMFVLFNTWNEFMFASILVQREQINTITVGILSLSTHNHVRWNDLMAASTISSLPLVILFIALQKYFVAGMTGGAVKS
ncbi:MAG: carbohydrate ABC transporter permease [Nitrososphaerota archaeon]|jgi:multiple sugar transport system permease protein|nr:carbohydrate ABC transporter permease [Nitrososphaerota archaeon]